MNDIERLILGAPTVTKSAFASVLLELLEHYAVDEMKDYLANRSEEHVFVSFMVVAAWLHQNTDLEIVTPQ